MSKPVRKTLVLSFKFALALALLGWVLSAVSWNDFVLDADGKTQIAVTGVADVAAGVELTTLDDQTVLRSPRSLTPLDADGPPVAANYLRPGFFSSIRGIRRPFVAGGMAAFGLSILGVSVRWRGLIAVQGTRISSWESVKLTWLGMFFNSIVLGTTGGDLVKAYYLTRWIPAKIVCLVTVVVDRIIGVTCLGLLSAIMLAAVWVGRSWFDPDGSHSRLLGQATVGVGILLVGLLATAGFLLSPTLRQKMRVESLYRKLPLSARIARAGVALGRYRRHGGAVGVAMVQSVVIHLLFISGVALLGLSLNLQIPWFGYLIFIPLVYIIASVPIVPGGIGVAEGLYVAFFAAWGSQSQLLALALLARLAPMLWSLPGVLVALTGPRIGGGEALAAEDG